MEEPDEFDQEDRDYRKPNEDSREPLIPGLNTVIVQEETFSDLETGFISNSTM